MWQLHKFIFYVLGKLYTQKSASSFSGVFDEFFALLLWIFNKALAAYASYILNNNKRMRIDLTHCGKQP